MRKEIDCGLVLQGVRDQVPLFKVEDGWEGNLGPLNIWKAEGCDHFERVKHVFGILLGFSAHVWNPHLMIAETWPLLIARSLLQGEAADWVMAGTSGCGTDCVRGGVISPAVLLRKPL